MEFTETERQELVRVYPEQLWDIATMTDEEIFAFLLHEVEAGNGLRFTRQGFNAALNSAVYRLMVDPRFVAAAVRGAHHYGIASPTEVSEGNTLYSVTLARPAREYATVTVEADNETDAERVALAYVANAENTVNWEVSDETSDEIDIVYVDTV